jgi:hypothetical protein
VPEFRRWGVAWGKRKENGVWFGRCSRLRLLVRKHDALFLALGLLRIRVMKPWR